MEIFRRHFSKASILVVCAPLGLDKIGSEIIVCWLQLLVFIRYTTVFITPRYLQVVCPQNGVSMVSGIRGAVRKVL